MAILKTRLKEGYIKKYFCGICYYKKREVFSFIQKKFSLKGGFDCRTLDNEIAQYVDSNLKPYPKQKSESHKVAFLATEYYDMGGHTEVAKSLVKLLTDKYNLATFFVKKDISYKHAPEKIKEIEKYSKVMGLNTLLLDNQKNIKILFEQIMHFNPKIVFAFNHMDDAYSAAILYMIKKYTDIKVVYFNHGSHYPALGFSFADLIWEGMPTTHYVTKHYRGVDKCVSLGLPNQKQEEIIYYSKQEIKNKRKELGIKQESYFTLSGATSYKFFDNDCSSKYFEMIKEILESDEKIQHIVMTNLDETQQKIVDDIFKNSTAKERLKIIELSPDYALNFQSCDVFIDSFPVSSALTQVDLMKWKTPTVAKINRENALFSFHEYFPKDYEYMFENVEEMKNGILKLLYSKEEQQKSTEMLFSHYMTEFEGNAFRDKIINIIENSDNLEKFYDKLDKDLTYNLEIRK